MISLPWSLLLKRSCAFPVLVCLFPIACSFAQSTSENAPKKPLTIESICAEGGLTGRPPETVKWSPDGRNVSFVQRDDAGEHGELWYVDAADNLIYRFDAAGRTIGTLGTNPEPWTYLTPVIAGAVPGRAPRFPADRTRRFHRVVFAPPMRSAGKR